MAVYIEFWIGYIEFWKGYVEFGIGYVEFWIGYVEYWMGYVEYWMGYASAEYWTDCLTSRSACLAIPPPDCFKALVLQSPQHGVVGHGVYWL